MGIISSDKNKSFRHELVGFGSDTTVLDIQRVSAKTLVEVVLDKAQKLSLIDDEDFELTNVVTH